MKKNYYKKPTMVVVEVKQQSHLLSGSNGDAILPPMVDPEDLE